jgi:cell division septation protein DedD
MASDDTEITLGMGRLVGLFFLLAAICGVFFSIGYSLGKSTAREQALDEAPAQVLAATPPSVSPAAQADGKAPHEVAPKPDSAQNAQVQSGGPSTQKDLTFYKAVKQKNNETPAPPNEGSPAPAAAKPSVEAATQNVAPPAAAASPAGNASGNHATAVTGPGTVMVQIAAVTREDDAVALAGALRKKNYDVIVVKNPAVNDRFYHVQVGPFTNVKEADAMKARLVAEGYNPIVKR